MTDQPDTPEPFFEPGHAYRSANGYHRFDCGPIIGGLALGIETALKDYRIFAGHKSRIWVSVMPEGCWEDVTVEVADQRSPLDHEAVMTMGITEEWGVHWAVADAVRAPTETVRACPST